MAEPTVDEQDEKHVDEVNKEVSEAQADETANGVDKTDEMEGAPTSEIEEDSDGQE